MSYTNALTIIGNNPQAFGGGFGGQQPDTAQSVMSLLNSAINTGVSAYQIAETEKAKKEATKNDAANLVSAKAADERAATAEGIAAYAEAVAQDSARAAATDPAQAALAAQDAQRAQSARSAANQAAQASALAGAGLSAASVQARIAAINEFAMKKADASLKAAEESSSDPKNAAKAAAAKKTAMEATAAGLVAARVTSGQFMMQQLSPQQIAEQRARFDAMKAQEGNFFTQKALGLPVYGWMAIGTAVAGGAFYFLKMRKGR